MPFGRKKAPTNTGVTQENVVQLARKALAERRATQVHLPIRCTLESPIMVHRWTQKAITKMLGKMVGLDMPQSPKDLTEEFIESIYRNDNGEVCIPCRVVKAATIEGAISTGGVVSKAQLKRELRVQGWTTPIRTQDGKKIMLSDIQSGKSVVVKMDTRIASNNGTPDVRSRGVIPEGSYFDLVFTFPTTLTPDKVMAALEGAGETIGLCEWRPEKGGDYGMFSIEPLEAKEVDRILKDCRSPEVQFQIPPEMLRAFKAGAQTSDVARKGVAVAEHVEEQHASGKGKNGKAAKATADAEAE